MLNSVEAYAVSCDNPEVQALVFQAAAAVREYRDNPTNRFTGGANVRGEVRAYTLIEAVTLVTGGALTEDDFVRAYARQEPA